MAESFDALEQFAAERPRRMFEIRRPHPIVRAVLAGLVVGCVIGYVLGSRVPHARELGSALSVMPTFAPRQPVSVRSTTGSTERPADEVGRPSSDRHAIVASSVHESDSYGSVSNRRARVRSNPTPTTGRVLHKSFGRRDRTQTAIRSWPPYTGALTVISRPPGARVVLDGRDVGTTPLSLDTVRAGEHAIRLHRDGYRRWSAAVRVISGTRNAITAPLDRADAEGVLSAQQ
jgi:hypothetical protein